MNTKRSERYDNLLRYREKGTNDCKSLIFTCKRSFLRLLSRMRTGLSLHVMAAILNGSAERIGTSERWWGRGRAGTRKRIHSPPPPPILSFLPPLPNYWNRPLLEYGDVICSKLHWTWRWTNREGDGMDPFENSPKSSWGVTDAIAPPFPSMLAIFFLGSLGRLPALTKIRNFPVRPRTQWRSWTMENGDSRWRGNGNVLLIRFIHGRPKLR